MKKQANSTAKNPPLNNIPVKEESQSKAWRYVFIAIAALTFIAMLIMSQQAGVSGDEYLHQKHSEKVWDFYKTFGQDTTAVTVTSDNNLANYGQFFDTFVYGIWKLTGMENPYEFRHLFNAICGWIAMLFVGLIAFRIRGWRAAVFAFVLMFLSPRFLGHSFNNSKDIPFAMAAIMALYFMIRFFQQFPNLTKKTAILLGLSIGLALGTRIGGLLFVAYFGLFILVYYIMNYRKEGLLKKPATDSLWKMIKWGFFIVLGGYVFSVLVWPYAIVSPVKHPMEAFKLMSQFNVSLRQNFEGVLQWSSDLPWYYTPKLILITIPIAVILGMLLYPFTGGLKKENRFTTFVVYFAFIFPIFWLGYTHANVYGGWRHSIFAYPPMVVAAGLGFDGLVCLAKNKYVKIAFIALPFLLLIKPLIHVIKNHPYEYVYFNELIGGMKGAYGNYEMDYYYHSTREASEWIIKNADISQLKPGEKIKVVTWHMPSVEYFFRKDTAHFQVGFSRWYERGNNDWDYAVFTVTGMNTTLIKNKQAFPPKNTAYTVNVDNYPICLVLKRTNKADYMAYQALQQNDIQTAVPLLQEALREDPYNEQAIENLANVYLATRNYNEALNLLNFWIGIDKQNTSALYMLANAYYSIGDMQKAIIYGSSIAKYNAGDYSGAWIVANAMYNTGNLQGAMDQVNYVLQRRGDFKPAYQLMAQIYEKAGDPQRAREIMQAIAQMP